MTAYKPTDEQAAAIDLFRSGVSVGVQAGAGVGKTSLLRMIGESTRRRGQYLAYNRAVVGDAKAVMSPNVACNTMHSAAFRSVGKRYAHRLSSGRMRSDQIARLLGIDPFYVHYGSQTKVLQPGYLAGLTMRALTRFCTSGDLVPARAHFPYVDGIDVPDADGNRTWQNNDAVRSQLEPALLRAWADAENVDGQLPYRHDFYLKRFQLSGERIGCDFLLCDELQDANGVQLGVIKNQTDSQVVGVGDSQQAIYSWNGCLDGFQELSFDAVTFLTRSWRFGDGIADVANLVLGVLGADLRLVGHPDITSAVGPAETPSAALCRTNAGAVSRVLALQDEGRRPHLVGGGADVAAFARAAGDLMAHRTSNHPELACFSSWPEVVEYVRVDAQGDELKLMVGLVEEYGVDAILRALDRMPAEDRADVIVSTAHRSKGRQWSAVQLHSDFGEPDGPGEEWRLNYVAVTRAQHLLDVDRCPHIGMLLDPPSEPIPLPAVTPVPAAAGPVGYQGEVVTRGPIEVR